MYLSGISLLKAHPYFAQSWYRFIFGAQYVAELPSYALIDFFSISYYYFLALLPLFSLMPHEKEEKWFLNV